MKYCVHLSVPGRDIAAVFVQFPVKLLLVGLRKVPPMLGFIALQLAVSRRRFEACMKWGMPSMSWAFLLNLKILQ